jgi:hypothetical protein
MKDLVIAVATVCVYLVVGIALWVCLEVTLGHHTHTPSKGDVWIEHDSGIYHWPDWPSHWTNTTPPRYEDNTHWVKINPDGPVGPCSWPSEGQNEEGEEMTKIQEHVGLLGRKVQDKVTGMKGVVTSVSFDLFGCVQGLVCPGSGKGDKLPEAYWMDVNRLVALTPTRVMDPPDFVTASPISEGRKGPANKPIPR